MEIVINKCYGGFGVSGEALFELIKRGSKNVRSYKAHEYFDSSWEIGIKKVKREQKKPKPDWLPEGWVLNNWGNTLFDEENEKAYNFKEYCFEEENEWKPRTDTVLIQLIKEKGSKWCSGSCAKLEIVEIPDDINWEISEYDGMETVREKSREWH